MAHLSFFLLVVLSVYSAAGGSTFFQASVSNNLSNLPSELSGYEKIGDKFYYIDTTSTLNYHEAWIACRKKNGYLASFRNIDELQALSDVLISRGLHDGWFWIDGNDLNKEANYVWNTDGNPVAAELYFPGEPNNLGIERCLNIWTQKQVHDYFRINNGKCEGEKTYICQLDAKKIEIVIA